nr:MAG TPA: hypothetical protein [Caudoviricetes sp.]
MMVWYQKRITTNNALLIVMLAVPFALLVRAVSGADDVSIIRAPVASQTAHGLFFVSLDCTILIDSHEVEAEWNLDDVVIQVSADEAVSIKFHDVILSERMKAACRRSSQRRKLRTDLARKRIASELHVANDFFRTIVDLISILGRIASTKQHLEAIIASPCNIVSIEHDVAIGEGMYLTIDISSDIDYVDRHGNLDTIDGDDSAFFDLLDILSKLEAIEMKLVSNP